MPNRFLRPFLGVITLTFCLTLSLAAQEPPKPKAKTAAAPSKAPAPSRTKGKLKPVDINSASKEEISFMLGIDVALAAKIVAGRPYPTKARLLTQNIVTADVYASIKDRVVAKQGPVSR